MKKIYLFVMLVLIAASVNAQATRIDEWLGCNARDAIIRECWNGDQVAFIQQEGRNYFVLHKEASGQLVFASAPKNVRVTDFELRKGTVYFCGVAYEGEVRKAMIGRFDVAPLFSGSGDYNFCLLPPSVSEGTLNYGLVEPQRIALFLAEDGFVHVAGVGRMHTDQPDERSTVFDVYYDESLNWHYKMLYNKDNWDEFLDVAATADHVVVAGRSLTDSVVTYHVYHQTPSFLDWGVAGSAHISYRLEGERSANGKVFVSAMDANKFALSYQNGSDVRIAHLSISYPVLASNIISLSSIANPDVPMQYALHDMRYAKDAKSVGLLLNGEGRNLSSKYYHVDLVAASATRIDMAGSWLAALDNDGSVGFHMLGISSAYAATPLKYFSVDYTLPISTCLPSLPINVTPIQYKQKIGHYSEPLLPDKETSNRYTSPILQFEMVDLICR